MAGRRPRVQRPNAGEHGEAEEQDWKRPRLQLRRKLKLREMVQIQRTARDIRGDNSKEDERASEERIKRKLHRAVFLVRRSPDRDEKIFRHNHELVENEEQKKIGAEKNAIGTADDQEQPKEELVRPTVDVPRKKNSADCGQACDEHKRETDAVERELEIHPERWNPRNAHDGREPGEIGNWCLAQRDQADC